MKPQRLQLSRKKGSSLAEASRLRNGLEAVNVARPSRWGNPFTVKAYYDAGYSGSARVAAQHCVDAYRAWMLGNKHWGHPCDLQDAPDPTTALRGKNLACWCKADEPCHADVLLELANSRGLGKS